MTCSVKKYSEKAIVLTGKQLMLNNIIQDDNSWIVDPDLISEKKIKSLIRRWGELGYPT